MSRLSTAAAASAAGCCSTWPALPIERGGTRLDWSALDWNAPAIRFYENLGAARLDEWKGFRLAGPELARFARGNE